MKLSAIKKAGGFFSRPLGKGGMMLVILLGFLAGYNIMLSEYRSCMAQTFVPNPPPVGSSFGGPCSCGVPLPAPVPCEVVGTANLAATTILSAFQALIRALARALEIFMGFVIDNFIEASLRRIDEIENAMMQWWDTMWWYNLRPSEQAMTEQLNSASLEQSRAMTAAQDAQNVARTKLSYTNEEVQDHRNMRPSEQICVAGTSVGGMGRATNFGKAMRRAWQEKALGDGLNNEGAPSAQGQGAYASVHSAQFENIFCDPSANGGNNVCGASSPQFYNADTKVTERLFNAKTIQVDAPGAVGPRNSAMVSEIINNLVGNPTGDPMTLGVMKSPQGQERWLARRGFLARHAAARSVPAMVASWRMPGSQLGPWVSQLRQDAGIPLTEISANPSYREVMRAISVERFNSGEYAAKMLSDDNAVEMEKLSLSTFYLMQLRDYYELLERTALTLAVQVSLMTDAVHVLDPNPSKPK